MSERGKASNAFEACSELVQVLLKKAEKVDPSRIPLLVQLQENDPRLVGAEAAVLQKFADVEPAGLTYRWTGTTLGMCCRSLSQERNLEQCAR